MADTPLLPITDEVAGMTLHHGERGEADPFHPTACFCGAEHYLACPDYLNDTDGFLTTHFLPGMADRG